MHAWRPVPAEPVQGGEGGTAPSMALAVARLQQQLVHDNQQTTRLLGEAAELEQQVQAARAELRSSAGGAEGTVLELRAQLAGLEAGVAAAQRAEEELVGQQQGAERQAQQVREQQAAAAQLAGQERQLDALIAALCTADAALVQQWRGSAWQAQEAIEGGILPAQGELRATGTALLAAMQQELASFREGGQHPQQQEGHAPQPPAPQRGSSVVAAVERLDPLARLKTAAHAESVLAAAAAELQELQPVERQWAEAAEAAQQELLQLQERAGAAERRVAELEGHALSAGMQQLEEAAAAAAEGEGLVAPLRTALEEWWTSPALHAVPWVKRAWGRWGRAALAVGGGTGGHLGRTPPPPAGLPALLLPCRRGKERLRVAAAAHRPASTERAARADKHLPLRAVGAATATSAPSAAVASLCHHCLLYLQHPAPSKRLCRSCTRRAGAAKPLHSTPLVLKYSTPSARAAAPGTPLRRAAAAPRSMISPPGRGGRLGLGGLLLALVAALLAGRGAAAAQPPSQAGLGAWSRRPQRPGSEPQVCVVVRTYWGHSQPDGSGLRRLIRSLQRQTVTK